MHIYGVTDFNFFQTNCYILFLDCTEAFDKVEHSKLFNILTEKICYLYIRIFINLYEHSNSRMKWNNVKSDNFYIGNSVKQGRILSHILFNIYLDSLLKNEMKCNVGYHISNVCVNYFAYADDINLLYPTIFGLNRMI